MAQQTINFGTPPSGTDGDTVVTALQKHEANFDELYAATAAVNPIGAFKNRLINGNFDFWQRGTSLAAATWNTLLADRWRDIGIGTTVAPSQQPFTLTVPAIPGESSYYHRSVVASVAGASSLGLTQHHVESVRTLAGMACTLSFYARADADKNIAVEFAQNFGTGGSPSAQVNGIGSQLCALTTSWQKFTVTVTLPSIAGKKIGTSGDDNLEINFWFDAGSNNSALRAAGLGQQSGSYDIAQVQLEEGSAATPFEQRPLQIELALCQRYFEKSYPVIAAPGSITGAGEGTTQFSMTALPSAIFSPILSVPFRVTKRTIPIFTPYAPLTGTAGKLSDVQNNADVSPTGVSVGVGSANLRANTSAASTVITMALHWTAEAEL